MLDKESYYTRKIPNRKPLPWRRRVLKLVGTPKLFFPTLRFILLGALVVVTLIPLNYAGRLIANSPCLALEDIRFEGCNNANPQELMKFAHLKPGMNIVSLNLHEIAQRLNTHPWVKEVKIERLFPHLLTIKVAERIPVALVNNKKLFFVDGEGDLFKEVEPKDNVDMPVITGLSFSEPNTKLIKEVLNFLDSADQTGILPKNMLSEVHVDHDYGITLYTLSEALPIRMDLGHYPEKLKLLKSIKDDLNTRQISPEAIDIISLDEVHVRVTSPSKG
jgi:cell division protein FtsQ